MRLIACYSIYNEAPSIIQSLDSVRDCDVIVVLDGAFATFPHKAPSGMSDDGTVQLVIDWLSRWYGEGYLVLPRQPWPNQMVKRSFYFQFGSSGDWFLVIDGDEIVESGLKETKEWLQELDEDIDAVFVKEIVQKQLDPTYSIARSPGLSPRIIRFNEALAYGSNYQEIKGVEKTFFQPNLVMRHLRFNPIRSPERRSIKAVNQTTEAFARVMISKPDGRIAGTQIRLISFHLNLRYGKNHGEIFIGNTIFHTGDPIGEISPIVLSHHTRTKPGKAEWLYARKEGVEEALVK